MNSPVEDILSPVGDTGTTREPSAATPSRVRNAKEVIGIIDNGKRNVALFVRALKRQMSERGFASEFIDVTKPRSAMPCPDLDALAGRCDYVINAVAD